MLLNLVVLGVSFAFERNTWSVALREFRKRKGDMGYFEAFRRSKDPSTFIVGPSRSDGRRPCERLDTALDIEAMGARLTSDEL